MNKLWIYLGCLAIFGVVGHADNAYDNWYSDDYWYNDEIDEKQLGIKQTSSEDFLQPDEARKSTTQESIDDVNDKKVKEEIETFRTENVEDTDNEDIDYYQIEDNRSEVEEDKSESLRGQKDSGSTERLQMSDVDAEPEAEDTKQEEGSNLQQNFNEEDNNDDYEQNLEEKDSEEAENGKDLGEEKKILEEETSLQGNDDNDLLDNKSDEFEQDFDNDSDTEQHLDEDDDTENELADKTPVSLNSQIDDIFNETKRILEESDEGFNDDENVQDEENSEMNNSEEGNEDIDDTLDIQNSHIEDIFNETRRILEESNEGLIDEENVQNEENSEMISEEGNEDVDDDTLDKALQDLKDDLSKLRETFSKLRDDNDGTEKQDQPGFDEVNKLSSFENEEDYEEIDDKNLSTIFEEGSEELNEGENEVDEDEEIAEEIEELEDDEEEKENQDNDAEENDSEVSKQTNEKEQLLDASEAKNEIVTEKSKLIQYVDDALVANEATETTVSDIDPSSTTTHIVHEHNVELLEDHPANKLSSLEFESVLNDILGKPDENVEAEQSSNSKEKAELNKITLSVDEPVVVTSPNYPNPYPTNAIVDWFLEGEGVGIELNITDFSVNGNNGDYVLIKPGSDNPLGNDGLVISHTLRSERLYRFLDVNRVFIRFESNQGLSWQRGFRISVKMMAALPKEDVSEPEALPIGYPESTITLNLGGVTLEHFLAVKETFRGIIADMATMYINANQIDPGLNTTSEVTQITSTALCFHNWPKFEQCAEVRFGVPLQYADEDADPRLNEEDLRNMWWTYSQQDPFALRLSRLGITEFQVPNDNNILMVWLVIAAGVVISMAMLAFALWRFSCFEDYTRMPTFSDTESITEKKTLDLYPTPHQTLPTLYSDTDYKWGDKYEESTRVDMGGFANRSYVRTDDYDYDSEGEVAPARDRNASISPRDIYNV